MKKLVAFLTTVTILVAVLTVATRKTEEPQVQIPQQQQVQPEKPKIEPPPQPKPPAPAWTFETAKNQISEISIRQMMTYFTSNELEGRMSGKRGNELAAAYVANKFREFNLLPGNNKQQPVSYFQPFNIRNVNNFKEQGNGRTANVVGYIPGTDVLTGEEGQFIIIGAHLDHIGYGPSYSRAPNRREIHPGADDNASGSCALVEIAKAFSLLNGKNKHTIVFINFSAEEMGLLGAEHYCRNPLFPLDKTIFMLNMDMIGRYSGNGSLGCLGANRSNEMRTAAQAVTTGLNVKLTNSTGGGSDHEAFQQYQIPTVFMHTGLHPQYHTPDDTANRIDYYGLTEIAKYVFHFCWNIDHGMKPQLTSQYVPNKEPFRDHDK